jgi:hypothetical protein
MKCTSPTTELWGTPPLNNLSGSQGKSRIITIWNMFVKQDLNQDNSLAWILST